MSGNRADRRIERTRKALQEAFISLFSERGYDEITIGAIAERAGVGRSTLYEHYRSKDELLAETIRRPFTELAAVVDADGEIARLRGVLEHFLDSRSRARATRRESSRRAMARILATMIETRLVARLGHATATPSIRLTAIALADALFGAITAWLGGEVKLDAQTTAAALYGFVQSAVAGLEGGAAAPA